MALQATDVCLGLEGGAAPAPLLWSEGGHPSLPATGELFALEAQLSTLSDLTRYQLTACSPTTCNLCGTLTLRIISVQVSMALFLAHSGLLGLLQLT